MELLLAWLVYPLLLTLVCGGLGLLVERLSGTQLPGVLVVPAGLAALVVVATLTTNWAAPAPLTPIVVVLLAAGGIGSSSGRVRALRPELPALAAALGVFAVFAAPIVLSGEPTLAGYGVLGDTAIQLIGIDRLLEHGHGLGGLAPSTYQAALHGYFDSGYPFGAQVAIGAVRPLVGADAAWIYQPGLAFLVAMLALSLYWLTRQLVRSRWIGAAVAFVAAQPALVYAYALQGSVKELATATIVALLVALTTAFAEAVRRTPGDVRATLPLAVAAAAGIAVVGPAVVPWLGPVALAALVVSVRSGAARVPLLRQAAAFVAAVLVLSLPALLHLGDFFTVTTGVVTATEEVGNLIGPLDPLQAVGIWINGDYRLDPGGSGRPLTLLLIGLALAAAVVGVAWAVRRRAWGPLLYVGTSLLGCAVVVAAGSPWADAKALMIVSPAVLLAALLGAAALVEGGLPRMRAAVPAGVALAVVLAGGVLLSNAFAYRDVKLAPFDRFDELRQIGQRDDVHGPLLTTEFEEFAKHFLRDDDPSGVSEAFSPRPADPAPLGRPGPRFGFASDLDDLSQQYVHAYRTILLRRSPVASRPPADYRRTWQGRWYELWERSPDGPEVLDHSPLGSAGAAAAVPRCSDVATLAARARAAGADLAYVPRPLPPAFLPTQAADRPSSWGQDGAEPLRLRTNGAGAVSGTLDVPAAGRYDVWLGGSFGGPVDVEVDGRRVGALRRELSGRGEYAPVGASIELAAGPHRVRIVRAGRSLSPGAAASSIGPLMLTPAGAAAPEVRRVAPRDWRSLCGMPLDWIEIVR
jgi:hypothetical protein